MAIMRSINYNIGLFAIVIFMLNLIDLRPFFVSFLFFFLFSTFIVTYVVIWMLKTRAEQTEGGSKER